MVALAAWIGARWVARQEREIARGGRALTPRQRAEAVGLGVREPDRVRVQYFRDFPSGLPGWLGWAGPLVRRAARGTEGMALGHGILLRADRAADPVLLRHELVHVAQYERLGVRGFLRAYLWEWWVAGYPHGSLEIEARRKERSS